MPRKTDANGDVVEETGSGFNEAAARCRGKHGGATGAPRPPRPASMRPRPDAAENRAGAGRRAGAQGASMRPRPDAAENQHSHGARAQPASASMRPRPDAAENCGRGIGTPAASR